MIITDNLARSIEASVLCWLATVSEDGVPNVSPKEAFLLDALGKILVANIASPQTVRNIRTNHQVCVSFVNVFVQKGYKIVGEARILEAGDPGHREAHALLHALIGDSFEILSIIDIDPKEVAEIIAPSYRQSPASTEQDRIEESLETYQVAHYQKLAGNAADASETV